MAELIEKSGTKIFDDIRSAQVFIANKVFFVDKPIIYRMDVVYLDGTKHYAVSWVTEED